MDVRSADLLYNLGYISVQSLAGTTESELRRTPSIGETIVEHCRKVLRTLNMSFRDEFQTYCRIGDYRMPEMWKTADSF
ncbi:hypothetical protein [Pirellula sp. SH-Sr6A]|uniref:hypothetical protein n=1 Tax=Pirellula sp. SH-Sr6A TaxID=1632865 RepID=UPI0011BABC54|nr:hypothetical protein [Pirellula sp. SH-Sr6A]